MGDAMKWLLPIMANTYSGEILRVSCRYVGKRRWRTFLLVPNEGEGYEELEAKAQAAAEYALAHPEKLRP
jgi:hypothetical protein